MMSLVSIISFGCLHFCATATIQLYIVTYCHGTRKGHCLLFADTWVRSRLFGGVSVAHLFSFLLCDFGFLSLFCVLCRILPVSLDCPFLFDPSVFSNVYLLLGGVVVVIVGFTTTYAINVYHH